jgi:predicted phage baseplate assembly protein
VSAFPDHCFTQNLFSFDDHTDDCRWQTKPFAPFAAVPDTDPAVYVGFDAALPEGLVSMYWAIGEEALAGLQPKPSSYAWEYLSTTRWQSLAVDDETSGLQLTGMVKMIGAPDQLASPGPSRPLYWIRARRKSAAILDPLPVTGIWTNAAWVTQSSLHRAELAANSDGNAMQVVQLLHPPVLPDEDVEVQEWRGGGREWQTLFAGLDKTNVRLETSPSGLVIAVWVRWQRRPHLFGSTSTDRHYTIDRVKGFIRFGDGSRGMIPPAGSAIIVTYSSGSTRAENVAASAISQLHSGVPFVAGVTNPAAAAGGAAAELISRIRTRGPARLRAGARALTPADYECMAAEASAEIAIARCLPVTGQAGAAQPGWVTVAIVPWSQEAMPKPSAELLRRVRVLLAAVVPAAIVSQVRVTALDYMPIAIEATLAASDPGETSQLESAVLDALDNFLHPLTGGVGGNGWRFGEVVYLSQVARAIKHVAGLRELRSVRFSVDGFEVADSVDPGPLRLPASGRHVLRWEIGA